MHYELEEVWQTLQPVPIQPVWQLQLDVMMLGQGSGRKLEVEMQPGRCLLCTMVVSENASQRRAIFDAEDVYI